MATAKFGQIFCLHVLELTCNPVTRQIWAKIGTILATHAGLCGHDAKLHFYMMIPARPTRVLEALCCSRPQQKMT